jgi:alpha-ketoglutarate-dependent taurine dioxygenase
MFENVPADYSFLRMIKHPPTGGIILYKLQLIILGDTLWASSVEIYERMSEKLQAYLRTLTISTSSQDKFIRAEETGGFELWTEPRGHPMNSGKVDKYSNLADCRFFMLPIRS